MIRIARHRPSRAHFGFRSSRPHCMTATCTRRQIMQCVSCPRNPSPRTHAEKWLIGQPTHLVIRGFQRSLRQATNDPTPTTTEETAASTWARLGRAPSQHIAAGSRASASGSPTRPSQGSTLSAARRRRQLYPLRNNCRIVSSVNPRRLMLVIDDCLVE